MIKKVEVVLKPEELVDAQIELDTIQSRLYVALQTSMDLSTLLNLFKQHVQHQVPFDALSLENNRESLDIKLGKPAQHTFTFMLKTQDQTIGALDFSREQPFSEKEQALLKALIRPLAYPLHHAIEYKKAVHTSMTDALTKVGNRAAMESALETAWGVASRYKQDLTLLLVDLDHFKQINDTYGHPTGDRVLQSVASLLKQCVRCADQVFRFGGEEFLVVLPNTDSLGGFIIAERIRAQIADTPTTYQGNPVAVTASLGLASLFEQESFQQVLERCDRSLYRAKASGRNCVCAG